MLKLVMKIIPETKLCPKCLRLKTRDQFPANKNRCGGVGSHCKHCDAKKQSALRERHSTTPKPEPLPDQTRVCSMCHIMKPLSEYHRHKARPDGRVTRCKVCACAHVRAWRIADPERAKELNRRSHFNLGPGEHAAMLARQNGLCASCGMPPGAKGLQVDHCHSSGIVRGLLCAPCNLGLGCFKDDTDKLAAAIRYLQDSRSRSFLAQQKGIQV